MLAAGDVLAGTLLLTTFPLGEATRAALPAAFLTGVLLQVAFVVTGIWLASRRLRRAVAGLESPDAVALAVEAHRLPARVAATVGLAFALASGEILAAVLRRGLPADLAVAAAGVGLAGAILAAMLSYSLAATETAKVAVAIGPRVEVSTRGTVRGKILVLGFGLNTIATLLLAATGYVRYRGDVDGEYVAAAIRAQATVAQQHGAEGAAAVAEHVRLITSAPTVAVDGAGRGATTAVDFPVPLDRVASLPPGSTRLPGGWLVKGSLPDGRTIATWLPEAPLHARRRAFWTEIAWAGLFVYAAAAVLAWLAAQAITLPLRTLGRAAGRIASGDLTAAPPSVSRDEMGLLASEFRRMAQGLQGLVVDVQAASDGVSVGAREAGAIGDRVRRGALDQHQGVVAVQAAVEAMEGSVLQVSRGVGGLSDYVSATTRAVGEMASALEEVERKGSELERAMEAALKDVEQLSAAGRDAESRLGELEGLASHTSAALGQVRASTASLERAATESEATAELVVEIAERAGGVVEETVHGIEALRAAVADAHRRIASLGRRSDDIDQVVDFISEVAGRTNLLSLNASIIASQAGEHGKAFSVVADQIRELASQIARSTKSIAEIIRAVREDVQGTAALIERGDLLASEGVQLARNSLEALGQIQRSTVQGRETVAAIRTVVDGHVGSSREVSRLVESVAAGSRAAAAAVQLVGRSVAGVHTVSRSVNAMADQVARALEDQAGLGRRQLDSLARLDRMIGEISRAVNSHDAATRRVRDALSDLSQAAGVHETAVEGLSGVAERLDARAKALAERVGRFKV